MYYFSYCVFHFSEDGNPSADVRAIISTMSYSALMGGAYGSFSYSKRAYDDFFLKNQSTLFQNQFEAKVLTIIIYYINIWLKYILEVLIMFTLNMRLFIS